MIEEVLIGYLDSALDVPVYAEVPADATDQDSYVVIDKSGSQRENHVDAAIIIAYSYAPTKLEAARLNEVVKDALFGAIELNEISAVRLNSDSNATDEDMRNYRYQCVMVVTYF